MKPLTLPEAERITAWCRRWFSEAGDTDVQLVCRCHDVLYGGSYSMALAAVVALSLYRRSLTAAIIGAIGCYAIAMFLFVGARQLARVRLFFEAHGPQNLSDVSRQLPNDRNA